VELFCCAEIDHRHVISGDLISGVCVMSASTLSRRACTAAFCAAFAIVLNIPASSQSLSYMPVDHYRAILPAVLPQPGQQDESTYGGQELGALRRQVVSYASDEPPGTIVIDTTHTFLYLTLGNGKAIRYGIGVGRAGFTWSGIETISRKTEWPDWIPPAEMIARQPYLPRWVGGGPGNPLGARALYLGNSAYRIHGTNDPSSIGKHVSSGCIRLRNEDVTDLYDRVGIGTKVVVLPKNPRNVATADQRNAPIERVPGVATPTRISAQPAAEQPRPRADWGSNPTLFGLY
jgi:lipoprotein-anchoring transpeptidase ErfK/SrfK